MSGSQTRHRPERLVINGRFLSQPISGVQRYAREIVSGIDRILTADAGRRRPKVVLLVPPDAILGDYPLQSIEVRTVGKRRGVAWEQVDLPRFARGSVLLCLANSGPILYRNQIVVLHDAAVHAVPQSYSPSFRIWYRLMHGVLTRRSRKVVTVSAFSAGELKRHYGVSRLITVIGNAASHLSDVVPRADILSRHGLLPDSYVLAFASHNRSKNAALVEGAFRLLPEPRPKLVLAGQTNAMVFAPVSTEPGHVAIRVGPVADDELKALYQNALCFVFPSLYEGFGIPALEAMACGCPVVVADAASLPEVCGEAALYCDPCSAAELADRITALRDRPALRDEMRRRGHARAAVFDWTASASSMLELALDEVDARDTAPLDPGRFPISSRPSAEMGGRTGAD